jgi:hypothetical protein
VKLYGESPTEGNERRYSPAVCLHARKEAMIGDPDMAIVSTSYLERNNLTMRMGMRRFTRLTNAFCRIHKTLRVTPAMEAGISNHVWSLEELAKLAD